MTKMFAALAFTFVVALASHVEAWPATCFQSLPATPLAPSYTLDLLFYGDHARMQIWRQACQDGSGQTAVLGRLTAVTTTPFVCTIYFVIVQNSVQIEGQIFNASGTFCDDLFVPTTVILTEKYGEVEFNELGAFTLFYDSSTTTSVDVPAGSGTPADRILGRAVIDGVPLAGRNVKLFQNGVKIRKAVTDADGYYAFRSQAPGVYEIRMGVTLP
jgi:hypothetical protein